MKIHYVITAIQFLFFIACNTYACTCKGNKNFERDIIIENEAVYSDTEIRLSKDTDSVEIWCVFFGRYSNKAFTIYLSDLKIMINDANDQGNIAYIEIDSIKNKLIEYINFFYIDRVEPIYLYQDEEPAPVTTYPHIRVTCFEGGYKRDVSNTTLYSNICFNPMFLDFYKLLESLTPKVNNS